MLMEKNRGFTLIELIVVVAIIAVLSTIGLASFQSASRSARDGKRKGDINQVRAALELYRSQTNTYPVFTTANNTSYNSMTAALSGAGYLSSPLPVDPKNVSPNQYIYSSSATGATYCLCGSLENGGGTFTNATCTAGAGNYYCVTNP